MGIFLTQIIRSLICCGLFLRTTAQECVPGELLIIADGTKGETVCAGSPPFSGNGFDTRQECLCKCVVDMPNALFFHYHPDTFCACFTTCSLTMDAGLLPSLPIAYKICPFKKIVIDGQVGANSVIDGEYDIMSPPLESGRHWYRNPNTNMVLHWNSMWYISPTDVSGTPVARNPNDVEYPQQLTAGWEVDEGSGFVSKSLTNIPLTPCFSCFRVSNVGSVTSGSGGWNVFEVEVKDSSLASQTFTVSFPSSTDSNPSSNLMDSDVATFWTISSSSTQPNVIQSDTAWIKIILPFEMIVDDVGEIKIYQSDGSDAQSVPDVIVEYYEDCSSDVVTHHYCMEHLGPGWNVFSLFAPSQNGRWVRFLLDNHNTADSYAQCCTFCLEKDFKCDKFSYFERTGHCQTFSDDSILRDAGNTAPGWVRGDWPL